MKYQEPDSPRRPSQVSSSGGVDPASPRILHFRQQFPPFGQITRQAAKAQLETAAAGKRPFFPPTIDYRRKHLSRKSETLAKRIDVSDGQPVWQVTRTKDLRSRSERSSRSGSLNADAGTGRAVLSLRPFPRLRRCSSAALRIVFC